MTTLTSQPPPPHQSPTPTLRHPHAPTPTLPLSSFLLLALLGCSAAGSQVPANAELITSQPGAMGFLARDPGTVYIVNAKTGRVIYSTPVAFGDKLAFVPQQKQIVFNGTVIKQPDLNEKHVHRLYFLKG
jgi:hypothetical protein